VSLLARRISVARGGLRKDGKPAKVRPHTRRLFHRRPKMRSACPVDKINYSMIDPPIRDMIRRLNKAGFKTKFSCAGHEIETLTGGKYAYVTLDRDIPITVLEKRLKRYGFRRPMSNDGTTQIEYSKIDRGHEIFVTFNVDADIYWDDNVGFVYDFKSNLAHYPSVHVHIGDNPKRARRILEEYVYKIFGEK